MLKRLRELKLGLILILCLLVAAYLDYFWACPFWALSSSSIFLRFVYTGRFVDPGWKLMVLHNWMLHQSEAQRPIPHHMGCIIIIYLENPFILIFKYDCMLIKTWHLVRMFWNSICGFKLLSYYVNLDGYWLSVWQLRCTACWNHSIKKILNLTFLGISLCLLKCKILRENISKV